MFLIIHIGDCLGTRPGHRGAVNFLSDLNFDLNLKISSKLNTFGVPLMLSSGADNIIKIWDMKRFKCVSEVYIYEYI
jgi:WD40 repeat protein